MTLHLYSDQLPLSHNGSSLVNYVILPNDMLRVESVKVVPVYGRNIFRRWLHRPYYFRVVYSFSLIHGVVEP